MCCVVLVEVLCICLSKKDYIDYSYARAGGGGVRATTNRSGPRAAATSELRARLLDQLRVRGHALLRHARTPVDAVAGRQLRDGRATTVLEQVLHVDGAEPREGWGTSMK